MPSGAGGLLVTLEYPQRQMQGPPFAVDEGEVIGRYAADWEIWLLERRDILPLEPGFAARGLSALDTAVYRLRKRDSR